MKLSIITINLNNASGLRKTIESIVNQTFRDFEYIIIDGGSTDGSVEVIKSFTTIPPGIYSSFDDYLNKSQLAPDIKLSSSEHGAQSTEKKDYGYAEPPAISPAPCALCPEPFPQPQPQPQPISYWLSEPDSGIYSAMNKGIRIAKGEYCQFLNSGDWLAAPDVTERMFTNVPDCSIIYGNMIKQMPGGNIFHNKQIPVNSFLTFYTGTLNHSSAYIKRSLFNKYGMYDESLQIVSDWKFYLNVIGLKNETVMYSDVDVTCFDMKGISNANSTLDKFERMKVLREMLPENILADYDRYTGSILQMKRINRYKVTRWIVFFIERVLFKLEKMETRRKQEHLFY